MGRILDGFLTNSLGKMILHRMVAAYTIGTPENDIVEVLKKYTTAYLVNDFKKIIKEMQYDRSD